MVLQVVLHGITRARVCACGMKTVLQVKCLRGVVARLPCPLEPRDQYNCSPSSTLAHCSAHYTRVKNQKKKIFRGTIKTLGEGWAGRYTLRTAWGKKNTTERRHIKRLCELTHRNRSAHYTRVKKIKTSTQWIITTATGWAAHTYAPPGKKKTHSTGI
jgi:hypothetical protein